MLDGDAPTSPETAGVFPLTLWTEVVRATVSDPQKAATALAKLCEIYRTPIINWFRRSGLSAADAEEQCQRFLVRHFGGERLHHFERRETRFRGWLVTCLKRQLIDFDRSNPPLTEPLDGRDFPAPTNEESIGVDGDVAKVIHRHSLEAIRSTWSKKAPLFDELVQFLLADPEGGEYRSVGERMGLRPSQIKRAVFELRHDYSVAFHREVRQICLPGEDEEEMRYLLKLVPRT